MKQVSLTQGYFALIDDEDYEKISKFKWYFGTKGYAIRACSEDTGTLMHRLILNAPKGKLIDHIDGNKLNNQKMNLRFYFGFQNAANSKLSKKNTSGYKGVSWNKLLKKWVAHIKFNGKTRYLGLFLDKLDAAKSYDKAAKKYFGSFARLNFI